MFVAVVSTITVMCGLLVMNVVLLGFGELVYDSRVDVDPFVGIRIVRLFWCRSLPHGEFYNSNSVSFSINSRTCWSERFSPDNRLPLYAFYVSQ